MQRTRFWLTAALLGPQVLSALDLTPIHSFRDLEGVRIPTIQFADSPRQVTYQPPGKWRVSGGADSAQLFPPASPQASVLFRLAARPAQAENEAAAEDLEAWCRGQLPSVATDVTREGEALGQFTLETHASRELTFSYVASGQRFFASVAAVDLTERDRFVVVVTARQSDFKAIHDETIASLFSWQWTAK
jgi:hypothetical protein